MDPTALCYAKSHEWVHMEGNVATVGISQFAVNQLTDLVHIELPSPGKTFSAGQEFGVVESVKAASDLYAPLAGKIIEANESLVDDLAILSTDPFGRGWMIRLQVDDPSAVEGLLTFKKYQEHCESESH